MSWFERTGAGTYSLNISRRDKDGDWSPPTPIAENRNFWVNWADYAKVLDRGGGSLVAHWLETSGPGTYDYSIMVSLSEDLGNSWSEPVRLHRDTVKAEHGFISMAENGGEAFFVWLDGREVPTGDPENPGPMTLRFTSLTGEDEFTEELCCVL